MGAQLGPILWDRTMISRNNLQSLKIIAKRITRARRIAHSQALDLLAEKLKQPHWRALTVEWRKGWRPEANALHALKHCERTIDSEVMNIPILGIGRGTEESGVIDGHLYTLNIDFEVIIGGYGWCILLGHAPSEKPIIEVYDQSSDNPIHDANFKGKALAICRQAAEKLRSRISMDWPRRSTRPDKSGQVQHPLSKSLASKWHCLHCDHEAAGREMVNNMWHCPKCSASPIDIFTAPFWKEEISK